MRGFPFEVVLPAVAGWLIALITLFGHRTTFVAIFGSIGCLVASVGTVYAVLKFQQSIAGAWFWPILVVGALLPFACLVAHVARVARHRRDVRRIRAERGF
jgi:cobalamin biosynthesis protein CobD/CbiB